MSAARIILLTLLCAVVVSAPTACAAIGFELVHCGRGCIDV